MLRLTHTRFSLFLILSLTMLLACQRDTEGLGRMTVEAFGNSYGDRSDATFEFLREENLEVINVQVVDPDKITFALNFIGVGDGSLGVGVYEGDTANQVAPLTCSALMVYDEIYSYQSIRGTATIFSFDTIRNEFSGDFQMEMFNLDDPSQLVTVSGRIQEVTLLSFE